MALHLKFNKLLLSVTSVLLGALDDTFSFILALQDLKPKLNKMLANLLLLKPVLLPSIL